MKSLGIVCIVLALALTGLAQAGVPHLVPSAYQDRDQDRDRDRDRDKDHDRDRDHDRDHARDRDRDHDRKWDDAHDRRWHRGHDRDRDRDWDRGRDEAWHRDNHYRHVLAPEWQRKYDSYYQRWLNYRATNNQSEVRSMEARMDKIRVNYRIPSNVPYGEVASNGGR